LLFSTFCFFEVLLRWFFSGRLVVAPNVGKFCFGLQRFGIFLLSFWKVWVLMEVVLRWQNGYSGHIVARHHRNEWLNLEQFIRYIQNFINQIRKKTPKSFYKVKYSPQNTRNITLTFILPSKYQNKIHSFPIGKFPTSFCRFSRKSRDRLSTSRSDWAVPAIRTLIVGLLCFILSQYFKTTIIFCHKYIYYVVFIS